MSQDVNATPGLFVLDNVSRLSFLVTRFLLFFVSYRPWPGLCVFLRKYLKLTLNPRSDRKAARSAWTSFPREGI